MKNSPVIFCLLILYGSSVSVTANSADFGGASGALGIRIVGDETVNLANLSIVSYVDGETQGSRKWGLIETSLVQEGDSFSDRFDILNLTVVSGWKSYGAGRIELTFGAGGVEWDRRLSLLDIEYGRFGVSLPLYGDWVRLAVEADLRTRMSLGGTPTNSTSIGLPISLDITTPLDRPLIISGEVELRSGLQLLGDASESFSVDLGTSTRAGYSVVQEPEMNVQIYLQHDLELLYVERDDALTSQMATLGVDFSL